MTAINTDFSRRTDDLPDAQALTSQLRFALERAAAEVKQVDTPDAASTALELTTLRDVVAPPLDSYAELPQLDEAILAALSGLPDLCRYASSPELEQTIKTLRRVILSDRRRIDPLPRRHVLGLSLSIRQMRLIEHRSDLLRARAELRNAQRLLDTIPREHPQLGSLQEHHNLLKVYCETQEAYCASVQQEMQQLQSELRG